MRFSFRSPAGGLLLTATSFALACGHDSREILEKVNGTGGAKAQGSGGATGQLSGDGGSIAGAAGASSVVIEPSQVTGLVEVARHAGTRPGRMVGLTYDGSSIWVAYWDRFYRADYFTLSVVSYDPDTFEEQSSFSFEYGEGAPDDGTGIDSPDWSGLAWDGEALWMAPGYERLIARLSTEGDILAVETEHHCGLDSPSCGVEALAYDGRYLLMQRRLVTYRYDPQGRIENDRISLEVEDYLDDSDPEMLRGVEHAHGAIWIALAARQYDQDEGKHGQIYWVSEHGGEPHAIDNPGDISRLTFVGHRLWGVHDHGQLRVYELLQ